MRRDQAGVSETRCLASLLSLLSLSYSSVVVTRETTRQCQNWPEMLGYVICLYSNPRSLAEGMFTFIPSLSTADHPGIEHFEDLCYAVAIAIAVFPQGPMLGRLR